MNISKAIAIGLLSAGLAVCSVPINGHAKATGTVSPKQNINMEQLTPALQKRIALSTPKEPAQSDLTLVHPAARLATARLPQGFTTDGTYFYYLSNLASYGSWNNSLRLTRIRYHADGTYTEDFMNLIKFGHGTNLDCACVGGVTYLWTGSDYSASRGGSTSISCFTFSPGTTLVKHGPVRYKIRLSGRKKYGSNIYPAISPDGKLLCVRIPQGKKTQYQYYRLYKGRKIKAKKAIKTFRTTTKSGIFQGFDILGNVLYTLEGSASKEECRELGSHYYPIKISVYSIKNKKKKIRYIRGASLLSHREPEGIQVDSAGRIHIMIASHYKNLYTCANIYQVK